MGKAAHSRLPGMASRSAAMGEKEAMSDAALQISNALEVLGKGNRNVREMRALILRLEATMTAIPGHLEPEDFKTTHHFTPGLYTRELFIPKDTVLTGKIHKTEHLNILSQGDITVWTEGGMKRLRASTVIKSKPGIKRVGYAHEDSIWITVHQNPTNEQDIKKVEARLFSDTFDEAYLTSQRTFDDAITFLGFTADEVKAISENEADLIPFQDWERHIAIQDSPIHGKGAFAMRCFDAGEILCAARVGGKRTPAGRFCNHSPDPNAEMVMRENGDVYFVAMCQIESGTEIMNDYYLNHSKTRPELAEVKPCLV